MEAWRRKTKENRTPYFNNPKIYCSIKKGLQCSDKKIEKAPVKRGLYYIVCRRNGLCVCQSFKAKTIKIPVSSKKRRS